MAKGIEELKEIADLMDSEEPKKEYVSFSDKYEEDLIKQLFQEESANEDVYDEHEDDSVDILNMHKKRPGEEWDVPITETIYYFDPELSYELTGYRPINMEQGLDFDPTFFQQRAIEYKKNNCYTKFPKGCKPYRDFWIEEVRRMKEGYTNGKYRITGDNYYFLNYYRMETVPKGDIVAGTGRVYDFPSFFSKQYEWFHYVEMAEKLHKDVCALKSRGVNKSCSASW